MKTICIYHGECTDGVAAAWAVHRRHPEWSFFPGVYQVTPSDEFLAEYDSMVLVDFSYKLPVMKDWLDRGVLKRLTVLDHHDTAQKELEPLHTHPQCEIVFNIKKCGALLAWEHFHEGLPIPPLLPYIDSRDRWVADEWELKHNLDHVTFGLRAYSHKFPIDWGLWTHLMYNERELAADGKATHRFYRQQIDQLKPLARRCVVVSGQQLWTEVPVVNAPHMFASELAGELAGEMEAPWAMCWWQGQDATYIASLRSRDESTHVGDIAAQFGGGGHPGAAGFKVLHPVWHAF